MARRGLLLVLLALLALPLLSQTKYALVIGLGKQEDRAWPKINGDKDVPLCAADAAQGRIRQDYIVGQ